MKVSERTCRCKITVTGTHSLTMSKYTLLLKEGIISLDGLRSLLRHCLLDGELLDENLYVYHPIKYQCSFIVIIYLFIFKL
jgi:hypothetical protein